MDRQLDYFGISKYASKYVCIHMHLCVSVSKSIQEVPRIRTVGCRLSIHDLVLMSRS